MGSQVFGLWVEGFQGLQLRSSQLCWHFSVLSGDTYCRRLIDRAGAELVNQCVYVKGALEKVQTTAQSVTQSPRRGLAVQLRVSGVGRSSKNRTL